MSYEKSLKEFVEKKMENVRKCLAHVQPVAVADELVCDIWRTVPVNHSEREACLARAREILSVHTAPKVPEGWRLVPENPTDAMRIEGGLALASSPAPDVLGFLVDAWSAMLAAAPQPTTSEQLYRIDVNDGRVLVADNRDGTKRTFYPVVPVDAATSEQRMYTHAELMAFGEERAGSGFLAASEQRNRDAEMAASLMEEAARLIESIPSEVIDSLPLFRWPLCDELGGAALILRDGIRSTGGEHE